MRLQVVPFSLVVRDAKENREKKWPREILEATSSHLGVHAAKFFSQFSRHANLSERARTTRVLVVYQFVFSFFEEPNRHFMIAFNKNAITKKATAKSKNAKNKISSR